MAEPMDIVPRGEIGREAWDAFVDTSDEAWLWHRYNSIDVLLKSPEHRDASFAWPQDQGKILAVLQFLVSEARVARVPRIPTYALVSSFHRAT